MKRKRKYFIRLPEQCSDQGLTEHVSKARLAGMDGVDWPVSIASLEKLATDSACELQESPERIKIGTISTACSTVNIEAATEQITSALRAANILGATCLNLSLPSLNSVLGGEKSENAGFSQVLNANNFAYALLRNVRFSAEAAGVAIALEAASGGCFTSPVELRETIDALHSWAIGVCVDVSRVSAIGCPVDWLQTLLHRVHAVRMDLDQYVAANNESDQDHSTMANIFTTLHDIRFDGALIVSIRGSSEDHWSDELDRIARINRSG